VAVSEQLGQGEKPRWQVTGCTWAVVFCFS